MSCWSAVMRAVGEDQPASHTQPHRLTFCMNPRNRFYVLTLTPKTVTLDRPSFLKLGTMSTKVAMPSLRGWGRWGRKLWPRVSRWWARYMQLLCWMAAR